MKCKNLLEVTVSKESSNESINRAERISDYWVFGGIFRPVYLEACPAQYIDRVAIDARADGSFYMDVYTMGSGKAKIIKAQVQTLDGKPFGQPLGTSIIRRYHGKAIIRDRLQNLLCGIRNFQIYIRLLLALAMVRRSFTR